MPAEGGDLITVDRRLTAEQRNTTYVLAATRLKVQVPVVSFRTFGEINIAVIMVMLNDDGDAGDIGAGTVFRNEPDIPSNERRMLVLLIPSDRQWEGMKGFCLLSFETLVDITVGASNDFDGARGLRTGFVTVDHLRRVLLYLDCSCGGMHLLRYLADKTWLSVLVRRKYSCGYFFVEVGRFRLGITVE
jgi:hypothetical protein